MPAKADGAWPGRAIAPQPHAAAGATPSGETGWQGNAKQRNQLVEKHRAVKLAARETLSKETGCWSNTERGNRLPEKNQEGKPAGRETPSGETGR